LSDNYYGIVTSFRETPALEAHLLGWCWLV
jgi:hypothetical protein